MASKFSAKRKISHLDSILKLEQRGKKESRLQRRNLLSNVNSPDNGATLNGTITYKGEGPIGFRGRANGRNNYIVENQWGGNFAPWHPGGTWVLGNRDSQPVVAINVTSPDNGTTLTGTMVYRGEGPIGFKGRQAQ